jgi:hypothetical protein
MMETNQMGHSANIVMTQAENLFDFKIGEIRGVALRAKTTPRRSIDDYTAI